MDLFPFGKFPLRQYFTPNQGADRNAQKWYLLARDLPTLYSCTVINGDSSHNSYCRVKKDVLMGLYALTFTFMLSSLPCLHSFWHAISTPCSIFFYVFHSCIHIGCWGPPACTCRLLWSTCMYMYMYVTFKCKLQITQTHVHTCTHAHMHTHTCTHVCTHAYTHTKHTHTYTPHACTHIHTYTHSIHVHAHTHTHTPHARTHIHTHNIQKFPGHSRPQTSPGTGDKSSISCIRCHKLRSHRRMKCGRCGNVFETMAVVNPEREEGEEGSPAVKKMKNSLESSNQNPGTYKWAKEVKTYNIMCICEH